MSTFFKKIIINTLVLYLVAFWIPSLTFGSPITTVAAAFLFTLLSFTIRPILLLVSLPLSLLSFGIFILVIDAWMLELVDLMLGGMYIAGFGTAFLTALLILVLQVAVRKVGEPPAATQPAI